MSSDGVLFKSLSKIHKKTKTPVIATLLGGFLSGILGAIFSLRQLVDMLSIGTLLAYSIVAFCVMILRYECYDENDMEQYSFDEFCKRVICLKLLKTPTRITSNFVKTLSVSIMILLSYFDFTSSVLFFIILFTILVISSLILIHLQPTDRTIKLSFKTPLVPIIPALSIFINVYLMMQLNAATWIRFGVWLVVGKTFMQDNKKGQSNFIFFSCV
jgi:solute carrier family 7 (cationic amino acid transporter), member 3